MRLTSKTKIFARNLTSGEVVQIDNLYWFEERDIQTFDQYDCWGDHYEFWIEEAVDLTVTPANPIRVFPDGDKWCALVGGDLQLGEAAFADSPEAAVAKLMGRLKEND